MIYTVKLIVSVDVEADNENDAINKASLEATFGTDLYDLNLIDVKKEEMQDKDGEQK